MRSHPLYEAAKVAEEMAGEPVVETEVVKAVGRGGGDEAGGDGGGGEGGGEGGGGEGGGIGEGVSADVWRWRRRGCG